ncbi:MAG: calcium-binding EGF-like domain-containing protein [Chitinophagales bacterium]|nr:calcium-binding EGF-like domain-containing protein [Chitinophagales bacterium]
MRFYLIIPCLFLMALLHSCKEDKCEDVSCLNGGTCVDGTCDCPSGFTGADCGTVDTVPTSGPRIIFKFRFDSTQTRLNNLGQPATMPAGHAGQSPIFRKMSAHYIELAPNAYTQLGDGKVLYKAKEVIDGGNPAIDFDSSVFAGNEETFFSMPISSMDPGTYEWLRVSLAYQNYDITMQVTSPWFNGPMTGRLASFVGFNTYIRSYNIKDSTVTVNGSRPQGYWGFETPYTVSSGQAPATTVPNPIASTSPIPNGSCVVTGQFASPLVITGNETEDIVIIVSLSTNKSFEWNDTNGNGLWDVNAATMSMEQVVDMGLRGLVPIIE